MFVEAYSGFCEYTWQIWWSGAGIVEEVSGSGILAVLFMLCIPLLLELSVCLLLLIPATCILWLSSSLYYWSIFLIHLVLAHDSPGIISWLNEARLHPFILNYTKFKSTKDFTSEVYPSFLSRPITCYRYDGMKELAPRVFTNTILEELVSTSSGRTMGDNTRLVHQA